MHTLISNRTRGSLQKYIYMKTIERFAAYCRFAPKSFTHFTWFCMELSFHAVSFMTALAKFWRFSLRIPWRNVQPYLLEKRSTRPVPCRLCRERFRAYLQCSDLQSSDLSVLKSCRSGIQSKFYSWFLLINCSFFIKCYIYDFKYEK